LRPQHYFGHSTAKLRLLGAALANLHREGSLAWIWVTQEQMEHFGAREEDCEGLVNYALSIGDVQVAVFFRELPDARWRVSLRSKGKVNVAAVAEHFGGGGHKCASGCSLDGPMGVAVSRIIEQFSERRRIRHEWIRTATDLFRPEHCLS
jgi:phosphoesterase RecJ-like protein